MNPQHPSATARTLRSVVVLLGIAYAGARWAGPFVLLDNLSNFPAHFCAAFLACAVLFACLRSPRWAIAAAGGFSLALAQVLPWYVGEGAPEMQRPAVKLLISNVNQGNRRHELLDRLVADENPDVIGLVEVNMRWRSQLAAIRARYPHHFELPDERFVGLGLYSRLPLEGARALRLPGATPAIVATLKAPGGDVELVIVHPVPPMNSRLIRHRNENILALARYARSASRPLLIAGDFNITMWNAGYQPLEQIGKLRNARVGHGIGPTWPSVWWLGVPIDHVLATAEIQLQGFRVLSGVGSDHLPVSTRFSLPPPH
jgi:endonuclease/exonuclease/phosphatase (EEP) superfamily protein YafD